MKGKIQQQQKRERKKKHQNFSTKFVIGIICGAENRTEQKCVGKNGLGV